MRNGFVRNTLACSFGVVAACAVMRTAAAEPVPINCTATLDGHAVDAATHEAVPGATVSANGRHIGETDANGRFVVEGICPGPLALDLDRGDYFGARQLVITGNAAVEVELTLRGETVEVESRGPPPLDVRSTTVLAGEALARTRGRGLSETLAEVPGVAQLRSATGMAKPIIRGQFGRRLLLFVDGVRHRAQEWGLEHAPEIDPFIAESITVVRGAGGVRYGPDAIGGAVLVEPPELRREPGYAGEAHLIGATNGRGGAIAARLLGATARPAGFAWQLEGSAKKLAGASTPDYALDNTGALEWSAGLTAGYRRGAFEHRVSYRRYQAELGVCSCLRIESSEQFMQQLAQERPTDSDFYTSDFAIDRPSQRVSHDLAVARTRWTRDGAGALALTYSFQHDLRRELDIVRDSTTGAQFNFRLVTHELEGVFEHNPIHLDEHWHLRGLVGVAGVAQLHNYAGLNLVPDHTGFGGAAFASERLVGHDSEFEAGLRYDLLARSASIERQDFLRLVRSGQLAAGACGTGDPDPVTCASRFHTLTASAGALRRFTEQLTGKLELSTASRAPNPDEQYLNGTAPTFPVLGLGKPDLRPETTYSSSATLVLQHAKVTAEASVYANLIDDYIYFAPAIDDSGQPIFDVLIRGTFPRFITKPVDALFYGADGGVAVSPSPMLELAAQVAVVRARNRTDDSFLVFVPPDRYRTAVTIKPPAGLGLRNNFLAVAATYVARQRRFDLAADFAPPPPAYVLLGAELGTETRVGGQTVKLALQGTNLTNARYRDYTSLLRYFADQPGVQVWLRMSVYFDSKKGS